MATGQQSALLHCTLTRLVQCKWPELVTRRTMFQFVFSISSVASWSHDCLSAPLPTFQTHLLYISHSFSFVTTSLSDWKHRTASGCRQPPLLLRSFLIRQLGWMPLIRLEDVFESASLPVSWCPVTFSFRSINTWLRDTVYNKRSTFFLSSVAQIQSLKTRKSTILFEQQLRSYYVMLQLNSKSTVNKEYIYETLFTLIFKTCRTILGAVTGGSWRLHDLITFLFCFRTDSGVLESRCIQKLQDI